MATAGEMIRVIAAAIARPQATVTSFYGVLRKAHLISTTGRGRSAQHLSPLDVGRILIVMLSADSLQEGEAVTQLIGDLWHRRGGEDDPEPPEEIQFEGALAKLIGFLADDHHGRAPVDNGMLGNLRADQVRVQVTATHMSAQIIVGSQRTEFSSFFESPPMSYPDDWEALAPRDRLLLRALMEGMSVTREIGHTALRQVAAAMP